LNIVRAQFCAPDRQSLEEDIIARTPFMTTSISGTAALVVAAAIVAAAAIWLPAYRWFL
jgi:hypothetical protein